MIGAEIILMAQLLRRKFWWLWKSNIAWTAKALLLRD